MSRAHGLLMTGGADIAPQLYVEEKLDTCGSIEPQRDQSDLALLRAALKLHKQVLCICRGCQMVNAYFGGTLYQDLPSQHGTDILHSQEHYFAQGVHSVHGLVDNYYLQDESQWLRAYQWHPELLRDVQESGLILREFIHAVGGTERYDTSAL